MGGCPGCGYVLLSFRTTGKYRYDFRGLAGLELRAFTSTSSSTYAINFLLSTPPFHILDFNAYALHTVIYARYLPIPAYEFGMGALL